MQSTEWWKPNRFLTEAAVVSFFVTENALKLQLFHCCNMSQLAVFEKKEVTTKLVQLTSLCATFPRLQDVLTSCVYLPVTSSVLSPRKCASGLIDPLSLLSIGAPFVFCPLLTAPALHWESRPRCLTGLRGFSANNHFCRPLPVAAL